MENRKVFRAHRLFMIYEISSDFSYYKSLRRLRSSRIGNCRTSGQRIKRVWVHTHLATAAITSEMHKAYFVFLTIKRDLKHFLGQCIFYEKYKEEEGKIVKKPKWCSKKEKRNYKMNWKRKKALDRLFHKRNLWCYLKRKRYSAATGWFWMIYAEIAFKMKSAYSSL